VPLRLLRLVLNHQLWINSQGRFGNQLDRDELLFENNDLEGVDFSRARLSDVFFKGGSLRGARFVGAYLRYATFVGCDLDGAEFADADLRDATFSTNPEKASFEHANLDRVAWGIEDVERRAVAFPNRPHVPVHLLRLE
jgi:uncharacterized protein YjbI with pentapeptide repeats